MLLAAVFAFANIGLVSTLLYFYFQSFRLFKSSFTMGLILFASFFLVLNLLIIVFWLSLVTAVPEAEPFVNAAAPFLLLINLLQTIGLGGLVWTTSR